MGRKRHLFQIHLLITLLLCIKLQLVGNRTQLHVVHMDSEEVVRNPWIKILELEIGCLLGLTKYIGP